MTKEELEKVIKEIYMLWERNKLAEDTTDDIDFILDKVMKEIDK